MEGARTHTHRQDKATQDSKLGKVGPTYPHRATTRGRRIPS